MLSNDINIEQREFTSFIISDNILRLHNEETGRNYYILKHNDLSIVVPDISDFKMDKILVFEGVVKKLPVFTEFEIINELPASKIIVEQIRRVIE